MKANELRIGNFIQTPSGLLPFDEIGYKDGAGYMKIEGRNIGYYLDTCKPIPLTEEWLVKLGFQKDEDGWIYIEIKDNSFGMNYQNNKWNFYWFYDVPLDHVHQLQNLYFALTGEELEVKP